MSVEARPTKLPAHPISPGVAHLDVDEVSRVRELERGDWLIVLWKGDLPVGQCHRTIDANATLDTDRLLACAVDRLAALPPKTFDELGPAESCSAIDASIVICTRDRPESLAKCLRSIAQQTTQPAEIIVVDNASHDDRTRQVAEASDVIYVRESRPGLDIARNTGARRATRAIVAYTDDDVVLHRRWLERLVASFDHPDVMAVTGLILPAELATDAQREFERYWGFGRGYRRIDFGQDFFQRGGPNHECPTWEIGAGASMAFRRSCFEAAGYFDERLDVGAAGCSGDSELWYRLLWHGYTCRYEPSAVAYHSHRREMIDFRRQIFFYMRGQAASLLVQFERTGHRGNLRPILAKLPVSYFQRAVRVARGLGTPRDRTLYAEVTGFLSGIFYYLRTPRRASGR